MKNVTKDQNVSFMCNEVNITKLLARKWHHGLTRERTSHKKHLQRNKHKNLGKQKPRIGTIHASSIRSQLAPSD